MSRSRPQPTRVPLAHAKQARARFFTLIIPNVHIAVLGQEKSTRMKTWFSCPEAIRLGGCFSRPDPCSVDFGRETPKFRFEFCRGFLGIFSSCFFQGKRPEKIHQKIPRKNHQGLCSEKFPSDFCRSLLLSVLKPTNEWGCDSSCARCLKRWSNCAMSRCSVLALA